MTGIYEVDLCIFKLQRLVKTNCSHLKLDKHQLEYKKNENNLSSTDSNFEQNRIDHDKAMKGLPLYVNLRRSGRLLTAEDDLKISKRFFTRFVIKT